MKILKTLKAYITSLDPMSAVVLGLFSYGTFTLIYILLGGQSKDNGGAH